jgi:hypothetical protein
MYASGTCGLYLLLLIAALFTAFFLDASSAG